MRFRKILLFSLVAAFSLQSSWAVDKTGAADQSATWTQLQQIFSATPTASTTDPFAQEIWVDGDFLKYQFGFLQTVDGGKFEKALDLLQGVKFTRSPSELKISVYFSDATDIALADEKTAHELALYGVHIPKTIRADLADANGVLSLSGLDQPEGETSDRIFLQVKIPVFSDKVYLRRAAFSLETGWADLEAGILGDSLKLIGKVDVLGENLNAQFDFWQSLGDNLGIPSWP